MTRAQRTKRAIEDLDDLIRSQGGLSDARDADVVIHVSLTTLRRVRRLLDEYGNSVETREMKP